MTPTYRTRIVAIGLLMVAIGVLLAARGPLAPPPLDPSQLVRWWTNTDPALAMGGLLLTGALLTSVYLLTVTTLDLVASVVGLRLVSCVLNRAVPAIWRATVLRPVAIGTLAVPTFFSPVIAVAPAMAESVEPTSPETLPADPAPEAAVITMSWHAPLDVDDAFPVEEHEPNPELAPGADHDLDIGSQQSQPEGSLPAALVTKPTPPALTTGAHVVKAGDSLWSIAAEQVAAHLLSEPSPDQIHRYWQDLIAANRDRLPAPSNPDLIFPGNELLLPEFR